jgi:c-di-GMP-binding flagellar brake protein YcgR
MIKERRKHPRVETNNLISYACINDSGRQTKKGRGKAINICQGGIQIETQNPLESDDILLLAIAIEDELTTIKGKAVYCAPAESGKFRTGIQFLETNEKIVSFVTNLLKTYSELLGIA